MHNAEVAGASLRASYAEAIARVSDRATTKHREEAPRIAARTEK